MYIIINAIINHYFDLLYIVIASYLMDGNYGIWVKKYQTYHVFIQKNELRVSLRHEVIMGMVLL